MQHTTHPTPELQPTSTNAVRAHPAERAVFVFVEPGAERLLPLALEAAAPFETTTLLAATPVADSARRAIRRLGAGSFSDTVIAVGAGVDHDYFAARAELARAAARKTAGGPLTLIASEHCAAELRHQLLGLAQALISEFGCPSVRVRFAAPS